MHVDDHQRHDHAADADIHKREQIRPLPHPVADGQHRVDGRQDDAAQRNDARDGKLDQEDDEQRQEDKRLQRQDRAAADKHALAALEAEPHRFHVADGRKDRRQIRAAGRAQVRRQQRKDPLADEHGHRALGHIADGGGRPGRDAVSAQHVGHAGAAAAVGAHIVMEKQLGDQDTEDDAAADIAFQRSQQAGSDQLQRHMDSSPFCLTAPNRRRVRAPSCGLAYRSGRSFHGSGFRYSADTKNGTKLSG